jgi:hypothetical protein
VISLDHQRSGRLLVLKGRGARRAGDLDVLLHDDAVQHDLS